MKDKKKKTSFNILIIATVIGIAFLGVQIYFDQTQPEVLTSEVDQPQFTVTPGDSKNVSVKEITQEEADRLIALYNEDQEAYTKALEELAKQNEG